MKQSDLNAILGDAIPLKVLHMHGPSNIGGKSYGSTIFSDKLAGAQLVFFPKAQVVAIIEKTGAMHLVHTPGIDSCTVDIDAEKKK